jgi:chromosome segregation ATPase
LTEDALKQNLERSDEREKLNAKIQSLNQELQSASSEVKKLKASKEKLEKQQKDLESAVSVQARTINSLKETLSAVEQREMEIRDERNLLISVEEEAQEEVENMKREMELAITREQEMADIKIRNKESMHREEMDEVLSTLQSTMEKLKESESLLKERSSLLGEMVDQNKELELKIEKEQTDLRSMEGKFAQSRVDFEQTKKDLKESQNELRRKEAVLLSKLKEERESKEFAEESLRKLKIKYNEAIKTQKCVTDLERQNSELRDKIRRQEAYLQRKLDKEKMERARLTPTKGIINGSPAKSISSRTPTKRAGNTSSGRVPPPPAPSAFTVPPRASKLPAPSSAGSKKRSIHTPSRSSSSIPTSSDRSVASELSSLLRTPTQSKEQRDDSPVVPTWEMDLE